MRHFHGCVTRRKRVREPYFADMEKHKESDDLVLSHLSLVVWHAKRHMGVMKFRQRSLDINDLIQAGNMGLMHAARKYIPSVGKFSTYANHWIERYILNEIDGISWQVRIKNNARKTSPEFVERAKQIEVAVPLDSHKIYHEKRSLEPDEIEALNDAMGCLTKNEQIAIRAMYNIDGANIASLPFSRQYMWRVGKKGFQKLQKRLEGINILEV